MRPVLVLLLSAVLCACGRSSSDAAAPWLTAPGVSGHATWFPLAGTPHDPSAPGSTVSCSSCHDGSSFAAFRCTGCHTPQQTDPVHLGVVPAYTSPPTSQACYGCHPQGVATTMASHGRLFPIGTASHPATCSSCHTDPLQRQDVSTLACASCHASQASFAGKHDAVSDFQPSSPACLKCHADDQVSRVADHQARFPVAAAGLAHGTDCLHCHAAARTDKPFAADFATFDCTGCHQQPATDTSHGGVTGYLYASASCYGCHPGGSAAPANHSAAFFPVGSGTAHVSVGCAQCHTDLAVPDDPARFACASCHVAVTGFTSTHTAPGSAVAILTVHTTETASTQLPLTSPNCLRCHADGQVDSIASHPQGNSTPAGNRSHAAAGCLSCHGALRADKPYAADFSRTAGCVVCHPNGTGN